MLMATLVLESDTDNTTIPAWMAEHTSANIESIFINDLNVFIFYNEIV